MMHIFIVILIIIIAYLTCFHRTTDKEGFIDRDFFYEKVKTWSISCRDWDRDIMDKIIIDPHFYSNIDPDYILGIDVPKDYLFLGTIVSNPVIILVPNTQRIFDFAELSKVDCFRLGLTDGTETIWTALQTLLEPSILNRITVQKLSETETVSQYGHNIDGLLIAPKLAPLKYLRTITENTASHLLYFHQINSGNYFILNDEKPFYEKHPNFQKHLLNLIDFKKQYPALTTVKKNLYLPTFKVNYVLSCHNRIPDAKVKKVLAQILRLHIERYFSRTIIDISHNKTGAPDHPIAIETYTKLHVVNEDSGF